MRENQKYLKLSERINRPGPKREIVVLEEIAVNKANQLIET